MIRSYKKFVAVFLAIWLPLFSGSALAATVSMQKMGGDCPSVTIQHGDSHAHQPASAHHSGQSSDHEHSSGQHDSSCMDCGVCHFGCSGYLASLAIKASEFLKPARFYASFPARFQSFTPIPLDPPPLSFA